MKYQLVRLESDPKIIGVRNGISQMEIDREYLAIEGKDEEKLIWEFVNRHLAFITYLESRKVPHIDMKLLNRAKLTDFMSIGPKIYGASFAINKKLKKWLESYRYITEAEVDLHIKNDGIVIEDKYQMLVFPVVEFENFNIPDCLIYTGNELLGKQYHSFRDLNDFLAFKENNPLLSFEKVSIWLERVNLDILNIRGVGLFMSQRLSEDIQKLKLTGFKLISNTESILSVAPAVA